MKDKAKKNRCYLCASYLPAVLAGAKGWCLARGTRPGLEGLGGWQCFKGR